MWLTKPCIITLGRESHTLRLGIDSSVILRLLWVFGKGDNFKMIVCVCLEQDTF